MQDVTGKVSLGHILYLLIFITESGVRIVMNYGPQLASEMFVSQPNAPH